MGKFSGQCETKGGLKLQEALAGYRGDIFPVTGRGSETAWDLGAELSAEGGFCKKTRLERNTGLVWGTCVPHAVGGFMGHVWLVWTFKCVLPAGNWVGD